MKINPAVYHNSQHLAESDLLPADTKCPFCGSHKRVPICKLQRTPDVLLLKCKNCHAGSVSRQPTDKFLDQYYSGYYESSTNRIQRKITIDNINVLARHLAKKILQYTNNKTLKILDYGGGDGTLSVLLAKHLLTSGLSHINIIVIDYNDTLVHIDDNRLDLNYAKTINEISEQSIDFIIASAVIEHIPNAGDVLKELLALLSDNGLFYARTPYKEPFIKLFKYLGIQFDLAFPAHVHDLGQAFWEEYFHKPVDNQDYKILDSRPSVISKSFRTRFFVALITLLLKAPWYVFGKYYGFVGGWEVFVRKDQIS